MAVAVAIGALLVVGGVVGVVVHDQQLADTSRQRALADLPMALKDYEALDSSLRAAEPQFAQAMVAFSITKLNDYGNCRGEVRGV